MYENTPPPFFPPPARSPGLGCFAKGCLTVFAVGALLFFMVGGLTWYFAHNLMPFFAQTPAKIRVFPATDAQYQAVEDKLAPFNQAVNSGHAATLALTADDINILIARDPQWADLRGKFYLSIARNELAADASFPLDPEASGRSQQVYVTGHVVFDASFAGGDFTLVLRRVEPLGGGSTPGLVAWIIGHPNFSRNFSRGLNDKFHENINQNPAQTEWLGRLQTVIVKDNEIVATALEGPPAVAAPANPP